VGTDAGTVTVAHEDAVRAVTAGTGVGARRRQIAAAVRVQADRARPVAAVPPDLVTTAERPTEEVADGEVLDRAAACLPHLHTVAPDRLPLGVDGPEVLIG